MTAPAAPTHHASMEIIVPVGADFDADKHFDAIIGVTKLLDEQTPGYRKQLSDMMHLEAGKLSKYSQCCAAHNLANQALEDVGPAFQLTSQVRVGPAGGVPTGESRLVMTITPTEPHHLIRANPKLFAQTPTKETSWVRSFMNRVVDQISELGDKLFGRDTTEVDRHPGVGWTNAMMTFVPAAMEKWVKTQGIDPEQTTALVRSKGSMYVQLDNLTDVAKKSEQVAGIEPVGVEDMLARRNAAQLAKASTPTVRTASTANLG
jgi:hypothetical protein